MAISKQAYGLVAGIAAVVAVTLFFLASNYPGKPEPLAGEMAIDQPEQAVASLERSPAPVLSVEPRPEDDHSGATGGNSEQMSTVTISMTDTGLLFVADKASLPDVLDALVGTTMVKILDLRPESDQLSEQSRADKRTFRISGSLDDVLHSVMDQYQQSYIVSHSPHSGEQEIQVVTLYLHGISQDDRQLSDGSGYRSDIGEGAGTERPHVYNAGRDEQEKVNISDVLRKRALSAGHQPVVALSSDTGQQSDSDTYAGGAVYKDAVSPAGQASFNNTDPITGDYQDAETLARLAEMTRRASRELQAVVEGLRAAEQSLKAQQSNQYGETEP